MHFGILAGVWARRIAVCRDGVVVMVEINSSFEVAPEQKKAKQSKPARLQVDALRSVQWGGGRCKAGLELPGMGC